MIKQYEAYLDCNNQLRKNWNILIDAFVEYYGEEKRQEIETKFKKALPIAYMSPDEMAHTYDKLSDEHANEIIKVLFEKYPSNWGQQDLFDNNYFRYINIAPLAEFKKFYDYYKMGAEEKFKEEGLKYIQSEISTFTKEEYDEVIKTQIIPIKYTQISSRIQQNILYYADLSNSKKEYKRLFNKAKKILEKINPNVTLENINEVLQEDDGKALIRYAELLPTLLDEYAKRMGKYEPYQREINFQNQLKEKIKKEKYIKLIEENKDLLTREELEKIEIVKNNSSKWYLLSDRVKTLFGYSIENNSPLESFSKEADEILNSPKSASWKIESIKRDRIKYFKANGIDLGESYDAYLKNDNVRKNWPSYERIDSFIESKQRLINEFNNEYYTSIPSHRRIREEINGYQLLDKDDAFNAKIYSNACGRTCVCTNIVKTDKYYDLLPLILICCNIKDGSVDHDIIHELNHLYELTLRKVENNSYEAVCGWDIVDGEINQQTKYLVDTLNIKSEKRPYELFNEIINEKIAQEIYIKMLEKDVHIFDTKENAKVKTSGYEPSSFLVNDFFNEFKQEIIESRRNDNIAIIWNRVGKENFDDLNNLFIIYQEKLSGSQYYKLRNDLENKKESEETRIYYNLIAKRDEILARMRTYNPNYSGEQIENTKRSM